MKKIEETMTWQVIKSEFRENKGIRKLVEMAYKEGYMEAEELIKKERKSKLL